MNNLPVLRFTSTTDSPADDYLEVDLSFLKGKAFTIAVVEQRPEPKTNSWILGAPLPHPDLDSCDGANPNAGYALLLGYATRTVLFATTWGPDCDASGDVPRVTVRPSATIAVLSTEGMSIYTNGTFLASAKAPLLKEIGRSFIGRGWQATNTGYLGDLAEVAIFDVALTDQQRQSLERYLADKWGSGPSPPDAPR